MSLGRVLGVCTASLAVAGCAAVAIGMSRAADRSTETDAAATTTFSLPAADTARPTFAPLPSVAAERTAALTSSAAPATRPDRTPTSAATSPTAPPTRAASTTGPPPRRSTAAPAPRPSHRRAATTAPQRTTAPRGVALPLRFGTGSATRVITVTARSYGSTVATLQAWNKVAGGGWRRYGTSVTAHVGADGMSSHPSETRSATPIGSFTLTQAFGHYADPGTALPYFRTTSADWWVSQAGRYYNTHQRCTARSCPIHPGAPNEHLAYELPYYNYAVVIDYNTRNAPGGVRAGAGSAFFLHVTDGTPTAGCVAIPQSKLISLMRWLRPSAHPRILLGVR